MLIDDLVSRLYGPSMAEAMQIRCDQRRSRLRFGVKHEFPRMRGETCDLLVEVLFQSTIPLLQRNAYRVVKALIPRLETAERCRLLRALSAAYQDCLRISEDELALPVDWEGWIDSLPPR